MELHKDEDHLRKEQDVATRRLRRVEDDLHAQEAKLQEFRREKQQRLNKVDTVVILRLSQLQHVKVPPAPEPGADGAAPEAGPPPPQAPQFELIKNTLVFNTAVLADLDRRKQQLDEEAKTQRAKHKWV